MDKIVDPESAVNVHRKVIHNLIGIEIGNRKHGAT